MPSPVGVRPCAPDDAAALARMYRDDRDAVLADEPSRPPSFFTEEGQRARITDVWSTYNCAGYLVTSAGEIVGLVLIEDITAGVGTVGYYLASPHRGRGVATEALAAVVTLARRDLGLHRLVAEIEPHNVASRRVVEKNGFRLTGIATIDGREMLRYVLDDDG